MSSRYKEHAKQLKGQDPVQAALTRTLDWLLKNTKGAAVLVGILLLVGVGYFGFQRYKASQRDTRVEALGKIQIVYEDEQRKANDERQAILKQIEALDAKAAPPAADPAKKPEEAAKPATPDPKVAAEKEALQKQAEAVKANHDASRAQFEAFAKSNEGNPEGWLAAMTAARLYLDDGKYAEARGLLETVIAKSKDVPFYQVQGRLALIGVLEELGDFDKALEETAALEKVADKEMQPKILLTRGRLQMLKNAKDDAKATFASLIEQHGASPEAQKARSIQALLN
jgi:predicted negative regulator of RcsB-dependent stress response